MQRLKNLANDPAFIFSTRICISATIGSLFLLLPAPIVSYTTCVSLSHSTSHLISSSYCCSSQGGEGYHFPDSSSVFVTCVLVSFFPSLDAASSMKKSIERCLGTAVGAAAAIVLGFISLPIGPGTRGQAAFLGLVLAVLFFALPLFFQNEAVWICTSAWIDYRRFRCFGILQ